MRPDIVVGFDGSAGAESAVDWAAREAVMQGLRLRVVTAEPYVQLPYGGTGAGAVPPRGSHRADDVVEGGRSRAATVLDHTRLESAVISGYAPAALVRESGHADLVVVGHRGHGRAREHVTGSVAFTVATHASCDVVVVPPGVSVPVGPERPVVVGVDGSDDADRAARRAAQFASERGAVVILVQAGRARSVTALVDACDGAGLLVVGSRSLGGVRRMFVGSVRAAVRRVTVPVLVVRG